MPLAFLIIFGGALLVYMGWKNESIKGILQDTLDPVSQPTQSQQDFATPIGTTISDVGGGINQAISSVTAQVSNLPVTKGGTYFPRWNIGRTDQGVDMTPASGPGTPLMAIGTSRVIGILPNWYNGQPFVWLQALDGPLKGRYYYYAEQITNIRSVGSVVPDRAPVAYFANSGTGVEAGLATASGQTLARATTGYTEGEATPAGLLFKQLTGL